MRDVAEGQGSHLLESFWHFAPELEVREERGIILANCAAADKSTKRACLAMLIDRNSAWTTEITEGFVSRAYGSKQVAPVVRASANVKLPARLRSPAPADNSGVRHWYIRCHRRRALPAEFVVIVIKHFKPRSFCFLLKEIVCGHAACGPAMRACFTADWKAAGSRTLLWFLAASRNGAANDSFRIRQPWRVSSGRAVPDRCKRSLPKVP